MIEHLPPASSSKCRCTDFGSSFFRSFRNAMSACERHGIVDLPRPTRRGELLRHAPDRRDADAAGKQHHVLGIFDQREIVARRADLDLVADFHLLDDVARAAAAVLVALDADGIAVRIGCRHDQRELAKEPVGQMQVDMRARLVGRQLAAFDALERVELGVAGDVLDLAQTRVDQAVRGRRPGGGGWCGCGAHLRHR